MAVVLSVTAWQLHYQGRRWWCACGQPSLWSGDVRSQHNSQHLFDPYSFTHVLHGVVFFGVLTWVFPRLWPAWRLCLALTLESLWEIVENSAFVIERYRSATAAIGYVGDSVANSLGDILSCAVGFLVARWLGFRGSVLLGLMLEALLLVWIRDNLTLNVVMLVYPVPDIRAWQMR
jgi:hypothetical protein